MATIKCVVTRISKGDGSVLQGLWEGLVADSEDGGPFEFIEWADRTIIGTGTWGGATMVIQGSADLSTWFTLTDSNQTAISKTADFCTEVLEVPRYIRPLISGEDGTTDLDVYIVARRTSSMRN